MSQPSMKARDHDQQKWRTRLWVAGAILAVCAAVFAYLVQARATLQAALWKDLNAVADLKIRQIEKWRKQKLSDAVALARMPALARDAHEVLAHPEEPGGRALLRSHLQVALASSGYIAVMVTDPKANFWINEPNNVGTCLEMEELVSAVVATGEPAMSNAHWPDEGEAYHLTVAAPLQLRDERTGAAGKIFGALVLKVSADELVQLLMRGEWPLHSASGEWQLAQRDGAEVHFLTPSRFSTKVQLERRIPLGSDIAAARAVRGERGIVEAIDYRGVPVVAALHEVPGTPWVLVSKIDREEAYAEFQSHLWMSLAFAGAVAVLLASLGSYLWRIRRMENAESVAADLARANRLFATLAQANHDALSATSGYELSERLCASLVEKAGMHLAWLGWVDPASKEVKIEAASGPAKEYVDGLVISVDVARAESLGPAGRAILGQRVQVSEDVLEDQKMMPWQKRMRRWGIRSCASVPLLGPEGKRGVLTIYSKLPGSFSPEIILLLERLAGDFCHALEALATRAVVERQRVALQESEDRYRRLFEESHTIALLIDPTDGRIVDANAAACTFYGYAREQLRQMAVSDLNPLPVERIREIIGAVVANERGSVYHLHHRLANGEIRAVEIASGPVTINGRTLLHSTILDETDRLRAEAQVRTSEERLKLALAAAHQGIFDLNLAKGVATVSPEYATMLGYSPEGYVETEASWRERIHPDDQAGTTAAFHDYLAGRRAEYQLEFRLRTREGSWKWIMSLGQIVERDETGRPLRMIGTHTDITERKENELALQFYARRTQALLDLPAQAEDCDELSFMQRALAGMEELTGSRIAFAHFVNHNGETIELAAWSKRTLEQYCQASHTNHYPLSSAGIWADAMRERRPIIFNDYASYPHKQGLPEGHSHLVRLISVPVLDEGKVVMVVGVGNSDADYGQRDVETVQLFAEAVWRTVRHRRAVAALRVSEQRWQFALDGAGQGVWDWNMLTDEVFFSGRLQTMLGYAAGEFRPHLREWESRVHPDDIDNVRRAMAAYLEGRSDHYVSEHRLRCKDGGYLWIRDIGKVMERDDAGRPRRMLGTHTDINEQKRAEEALRASEARLRRLFESLEAGVVVRGAQAEVNFANPLACDILGLSLEQMRNPELRPADWCFLREDCTPMPVEEFPTSRVFAARQTLRNITVGVQRRVGDVVWVLVNAYPEFDGDGRIAQVVIVFLDITERRQQEQLIREREARWLETLLTAMDGYVAINADGRILEVNPAYERISGYSSDEISQLHISELDPDLNGAEFERLVGDLRLLGSKRFRSRLRRKDGELRRVEISLSYSPRLGGRISSFVRDVTEQQAAAERLQVQSAALEAAANNIVITDASGRIEWVNEAFTRATGYTREEALGQNPRVLKSGRHTSEFYAQLWQTILAGNVWQGELTNVRKDGVVLEEAAVITPVRASGGAITHFVAIKQDITERKRLERRMLHAQRMEGIGLLAGGIAHDLNNVLAPILLGIQLLRRREQESADARTLAIMESAARRGAGMVKQVLTFARGIEGDRVSIRPRDLINELALMIEETFPRNIQLRREIPELTSRLSGDVTQLHQVLLNLAVNARDAMPAGGILTLGLKPVDVPAGFTVHTGDLKPGPYLVLTVQDTGEGIAPEVRDRIFDPFFTTKPQGKGTGLGLPTVLGIVRSHDGGVDLSSQLGVGSEFRVYLPALLNNDDEERSSPDVGGYHGGGRLVLVVDDEESIREVASVTLRTVGFAVIEARDGRDAIRVFNENRDRIDAVVTDIMMPLLTGDRAAAEMWKARPDLPILFMSGLMEQDAIQAAFKDFGPKEIMLLRKPFTVADLVEQLARVLGLQRE